MTEDLRSEVHKALQQIRGLDPNALPTEPIGQAAWMLETNNGRRHPLDVVISGSLQPALKARGFHRKARTWNRRVGGLVHVINLQSSKYNVLTGRSPCLFYVNIGVFIPEVQELVDREPGGGFILEYRCHIRHRLNQLSNDQSQLIMSLEPDRTLEQQGEQVTRGILDAGVGYLDQFTSLEALYAILRFELDRGFSDARGFPLVYAAAKTGDRGRAEAAFADIVERMGRNTTWRARLERIAQELGLPLRLPDPEPTPTAQGYPAGSEVLARREIQMPAPAEREAATTAAAEKAPLIAAQRRAIAWRMELADCRGLKDDTDAERTIERLCELGLAPTLGPWDWQGGRPRPVDNVRAWMDQVHYESETWKRWKASTRKLSRSNVTEHWSSAALRTDKDWPIVQLAITRYGRDNWHLSMWAQQRDHATAGVPLDDFAESWAGLLQHIIEELRPMLRPALAIMYASESYVESVEDLERGALLVGWRTWYGPSQAERFGREFLLGLPDSTQLLDDGTIVHRLAVPAPQMVLPSRGKFAQLRAYLQSHPVELGFPRL